jgi:TPR repeat protein
MEIKMKKIISLLCFLLMSSFCFSDDGSDKFIQDVIWIGCNNLNEPCPKICKNNTERQELLNNGLSICEKKAAEGSLGHQLTLASYHYFITKNTQRSLYWANKCAEQGNTDGMLLLFDAYKSGNGVVGDAEEALKWLWLASSLGNEHAKELMKHANVINLFNDQKFANLVYERARQWMRDHPNAFFDPNAN